MTHCSDIDTLVSLNELLGGRTLVELRHILECDQCGEHLETLTTLRAGLGRELDPEPGFADAVLRTLPAGRRGQAVGAFVEKWGGRVASPVLAAFTALLFLVQAAGASGMSLGMHVPAMAGLTGVAVALWNQFGAREKAVPLVDGLSR